MIPTCAPNAGQLETWEIHQLPDGEEEPKPENKAERKADFLEDYSDGFLSFNHADETEKMLHYGGCCDEK